MSQSRCPTDPKRFDDAVRVAIRNNPNDTDLIWEAVNMKRATLGARATPRECLEELGFDETEISELINVCKA